MKRSIDARIALLLHVLDEAYGKPAWHGTNLRGALRGVSLGQAMARPGPGRHNIRELAAHATYWKFRVRQRLSAGSEETFPLSRSHWPRLGLPSEKAWRAERESLDREHRALRRVVASFPPSRLDARLPGTRRRTATREIAGVALHDVYHTGQIQILKKLTKAGRGASR